jgi:hypothetical protein
VHEKGRSGPPLQVSKRSAGNTVNYVLQELSGVQVDRGRLGCLSYEGRETCDGAVAFVDHVIKAGWTYEIRSPAWLVAAGVGFCRVPLPA